jgi:predicted small lipoprotein YifL
MPLGRLGAALRVAVVVAVATLAGCGALGFPPGAEDQTPKGTVARYLDAAVAGDCRLASQLATTDLVRQGLWCENPRVLSYGDIDDGELIANPNERYFVVEAVVIGGTGLELLGLQAGENDILVQVLQDADGSWRVNQTFARQEPLLPPQ